ncbi:MAG: cytochrome P450 [Alphaproteobacteria bacterium]
MNQLSDYHPFDREVVECPFDFNRLMRRQAPVYLDPNTGFYLVSRYDLVQRILKDPGRFSSKFSAALRPWDSFPEKAREIMGQGWPATEILLTTDPPDHARSRALVSKAFSLKRVQGMQPFMEETVDRLLDRLISQGHMEFREDFALVLPLMITAQQFRVADDEVDQIKHWSDIFAAQLGQEPKSEDEIVNEAREMVAFQKYFAAKLDEVRADPGDEIISVIGQAMDDPDDPLSMADALEIINQAFVAGHETTTSAMTAGMQLLIEHPEQLKLLQDDPSLIPNFCEEVLRIESPTNNMWRIAREDVELEGVTIPEGAVMLLRFGSANRDEAKFGAESEKLDVCRKDAREHLAFGAGPHFCIGALVARQEMRKAFERLLARATNFRLAPGHKAPEHMYSVLLRGLQELHIEFDPV